MDGLSGDESVGDEEAFAAENHDERFGCLELSDGGIWSGLEGDLGEVSRVGLGGMTSMCSVPGVGGMISTGGGGGGGGSCTTEVS